MDLIRVKGKVKPVRIFELQAFKGALDDIQKQVNSIFEPSPDKLCMNSCR